MSPEHLDRLSALFKDALALPPDQQAAFVEAACPDDPVLRDELRSLLRADQDAEDSAFLEDAPLDLHTAGHPPEDALLGHTVGPYRLLRLLGRGGMGHVYLARREAPFKQHVALKLIQQGIPSPDALQRFEMERQILASLNHPNIARLLDGGTTEPLLGSTGPGGYPYLVMEHVDGLRITDYCDTHRLSINTRLRLFAQACRAVAYAHQNLVVHRDLKPSNIFVTDRSDGTESTPQVKLLDFGVAKLLNPALSNIAVPVTRTMHRMMTPEYAAPEQVRGETVTTATDVYALGVILYELLTGHRPYHLTRNTPLELERVICQQIPERPSTKVVRDESYEHEDGTTQTITAVAVGDARGLPVDRLRRRLQGDLDNIVLKALRKEPARRYRSVEQLSLDVERYLDGLPVEARSSTMGYRLGKFVGRHRVAVLAGLGVLLSLLGGLSLALWQGRQARLERDRSAQLLARAEAVTGFMQGLFDASDPDEALGDTLTSYDLLARGVQRLETLSQDPEVQAEVLTVVGDVYVRMGEYNEAEPLLRRALTLRRQALGPEHLDLAETLQRLGHLLTRKGEFDEAEPLIREALAMRRRLLGEEHLDVARSLNMLAILRQEMGDYDDAEQLYRESLALRRRLLDEEAFEVVTGMNNLALVLHQKGNYAEAEPLFREAVAIDRKTLEKDHPDTANDIHNLAYLLMDKGDFDAAEALFQESLAISRKVLGEAHPLLAKSLNGLAQLYIRQGRYEDAEQFIREALAINRKQRGEAHPLVASNLNTLGMLRYLQDDYPAAEALLQQALALHQKLFKEAHPLLAKSLHHMGVLRSLQGDYAVAESFLRQALAMRQDVLGPEHPDVAETLGSLGDLLKAQGSYDAAEPLYQQALAILRSRFAETHPWARQVYAALVELYDAWGKPDLAAQYRQRPG